jgi:hypothetical protein
VISREDLANDRPLCPTIWPHVANSWDTVAVTR